MENGTVFVFDFISQFVSTTFAASDPLKGYFSVTPIVTDSIHTYLAVSYNDNADSSLDSSSRYLQTIRILDYY